MIALGVADLVVIASRTLGLDTGLVLDLLDPAAAERALARTRPGGEPGDPAGPAAALLQALVRERPLGRGNQQVALAATLQFLALNGWDIDPDPQIAALVTGLAAGTLDTQAAAALAGAPAPLRGPRQGGTHAQRGVGREDQDGHDAHTAPEHVPPAYRPGPAGRPPRPGGSPAAASRPGRHRAPPARPALRGGGRRRPRAGVAGHLPAGRARPGRRDHRARPEPAARRHPVHPGGQEGT